MPKLLTRLPVLLSLVSLLACGDGGTAPPVDFDAEGALSRVDDVVEPLEGSENLMVALESATAGLTEASAEPVAWALRIRPGLDPRAAAGHLRHARRAWETALTFPPELVGTTLVWDAANDRYVADESRTGAPAGGVRIIYYAMNPITRQPVEPVVELGFIDLVDEDDATREAVGVRVIDTTGTADVTLVDYSVALSGQGSAAEGEIVLTAAGALSTGPDGVEFDLTQTFTWDEAADLEELSLAYVYEAGGAGVTLEVQASSAFEALDWETMDVRLHVTGGAREVELTATLASDGALDGELRADGQLAVVIGGTELSPAFTRPDGAELTQQQRQALRELWLRVGILLTVTQGLFAPAGLLLLPG